MLRINQQCSSAGAKSYFEEGLAREDYYTRDAIPGHWGGRGAELLGLTGEVGRDEFLRLCDNLNPVTGEKLTPRTRDGRTVGYDINFHAPKSLSLLYSLTKDDRLLAAFRSAVRETMAELEGDVKTRVRSGGQNTERPTSNLLYAEFVHLTARPVNGVPDPHLHAHCFTFNATFDAEEDRWKAGQFREVVRDAPYFEAAFHARLSKAVADLGLGVERTRNGWEVAGISRPVVEKFSRRTELIEEVAAAMGVADPREKGELGARTRERKGEPKSLDALRAEWKGRLTHDEKREVLAVLRGQAAKPQNDITPRGAVDHAVSHAFERVSVMTGRRVVAAALRRGYGRLAPGDVNREFAGRTDLIRRRYDERDYVTTREVLAEEAAALAFARSGRGTCSPITTGKVPFTSDRLNPEQQEAVRHVLTGRDRVMLIRGKAGTGKTTLLREAAKAVAAAGKQVYVFAPTTEAARGILRRDGFDNADTVARLLADEALQGRIRGQVVWVDEAGLMGMKDMKALFAVAERQNARVVLMGDEGQHSSVPRGDAFRLLQTHAGLPAAEVRGIQRQTGTYRKAVEALSVGDVGKGIELLDSTGAISEVAGEWRHARLASDYLEAVRAGETALVVAPTHVEGRSVTTLIREYLRQDKLIGGRDRVFEQLVSYGLTEAQRTDAKNYTAGDVVRFHQNAKGGFRKGERVRVLGLSDEGRVLVERKPGETLTLPLSEARQFDLYERREIKLTAGDRVRITQNGTTEDGRSRLLNGTLQTVAGFNYHGHIVLENGQVVGRDFGHLAHGYCTTSHASQGKTVDRVFVAVGPESFAAASREQLYVSVSRGRKSARLYCESKSQLLEAVRGGSQRLSATELVRAGERARQSSRLVRLAEHIRRVTRWETVRRLVQRRDRSAGRDTVAATRDREAHGR